MKVFYQAAEGEDEPRIGESVCGHLQYRVVDVIWMPLDGTVHVVLKKKDTP